MLRRPSDCLARWLGVWYLPLSSTRRKFLGMENHNDFRYDAAYVGARRIELDWDSCRVRCGLWAVICETSGRLDNRLLGEHGLDQRDRLPLSLSSSLTVPHPWRPLPDRAGCRYASALRPSSGGRVAWGLRRDGHARAVFQCICADRATVYEGARVESPGSDAIRAAISDRPDDCAGSLHRAQYSRVETVSPGAGPRGLVKYSPTILEAGRNCSDFPEVIRAGAKRTQ